MVSELAQIFRVNPQSLEKKLIHVPFSQFIARCHDNQQRTIGAKNGQNVCENRQFLNLHIYM